MWDIKGGEGQLSGDSGRRLAEVAFDAIKRAIIRCDVEPGSRVTEAQLAERFAVGRAAARTALHRLAQAGLLQVMPRQGYRVAPVTVKDVNDLFGVRLLLEPAASRLAAGRLDRQASRRLRELCQASYLLGDRESAVAFLRANSELHVTIARASGNDRLARLVADLLDDMERLFHLGLMQRDRNEEMYHEHQELVEALEAGDGERAERITAEQLRAAQKMVMDGLLSNPSVQSAILAAP